MASRSSARGDRPRTSGRPRPASWCYRLGGHQARSYGQAVAPEWTPWTQLLRRALGLLRPVDPSRRRVKAALAGRLPMSALRPAERATMNAELDAAITARAESICIAAIVAAEGVTTVSTEDGALVEYSPDGRMRRLAEDGSTAT